MRFNVLILGLGIVLFGCDSEENKAVNLSDENLKLSFDKLEFFIFNTPTNESTYAYGERLNIEMTNLYGFEESDGAVYPGVSFTILAPDGSVLQDASDLYEGQNVKLENDQTFDPSFYVDLLYPIIPGNGYTLKLKMWDKKSNRSFPIKKTFNVQPPITNGFAEEQVNGIEPALMMVFRNGKPYSGNTFSIGDRIHLHIILPPTFLEQHKPFSAEIKSSLASNIVFQRNESGTFSEDMGPLNSYLLIREEDYTVGNEYLIEFRMETYGNAESYSVKFPIEIVQNAD